MIHNFAEGLAITDHLTASNIPVIPASIVCPGLTGPTPEGVPVKIKSPGSNVIMELMCSIKEGILGEYK